MKTVRALACLALLLPTASFANPERINEIITGNCALCHGLEGESASPVFPRLAAQHPEYMAKQLRDFRDGRRKGTTMNAMAAELKNDEVVALAGFYAKKKAAPHAPAEPDLAAVGKYVYEKGNKFTGVPSCASCHGAKAHGTAQLPRLAGQNAQYLETQLKEFNQRVRNNDNAVMHTIAAKLSELESVAVSEYMSSLD